MSIKRDARKARNELESIRIDKSLVRYKYTSISLQITAFRSPL
jgi:hypothetical protein